MRLRRRLNTVLLQWFLLFVIVAGAVWVIAFPGIRKNVSDDRLLLARTIAQSLDATISNSLQSLGRLAAELPLTGDQTVSRLHTFRLQLGFGDSTYLLDEYGAVLAADPLVVSPIPVSALGAHEAITPLIRKPDGSHAVLAIVQPFKRDGRGYYLVAEMNPLGSPLDAFLKSLEAGPSMSVAVVDENGAIVASPEPALLLQMFPAAEVLTDRIRSHRAYVAEDLPSASSAAQANGAMLTVMAPLRFASWGVVIQERADRAYSGLRATGLGLVLSALGLVLTGVLLARTLSRSVVTPISRLSVQASALRGGDLSRPITVSGDHEIEVLAQTLDDARVKLGATLAELQAFNVRLEDEVVARTKVILAQDEQRKALLRRLLAATEDERRRIARELHDEIAQLLTAIQLSLHHVGVDTPEMKRAGDLLVRTHQEIHRIIHDLRPSLLDDLGLAAAIESHAKDYLEGGRLRVNLDIPDDLPHRPEIETVIFRIYQELVTNVLRHADADQLSVELYERDGKLVLTVEDDGKGFDPDAHSDSPGLTGMRERAAFVNGTIRFDSAPGVGTQATVEIPLR